MIGVFTNQYGGNLRGSLSSHHLCETLTRSDVTYFKNMTGKNYEKAGHLDITDYVLSYIDSGPGYRYESLVDDIRSAMESPVVAKMHEEDPTWVILSKSGQNSLFHRPSSILIKFISSERYHFADQG